MKDSLQPDIAKSRKYLRWVDAPIWVKIGRNIRDCRKWKKFTPEEVALKANIDLTRYKRMERAIVRDITFDEALRIATALKIRKDSIDEIFHC